MEAKTLRRPDAVDAIRVLALAVLAIALSLEVLKRCGAPRALGGAAIQGALLLVPLAYALGARLPIGRAFRLRLPPPATMVFVAVASISSMWLLQGATLLQDWIVRGFMEEPALRQTYEEMERQVSEVRDRSALLAILLLSVVPALCEETFFRGLVFRGLGNRWPIGGLVVTSALFALMHIEPLKLPLMMLLGLFFGALVLLTRSLWSSILAHMLNNAAVVFVSGLESKGYSVARPPWWLYLMSAAVLTGSLWVLWVRRPREE